MFRRRSLQQPFLLVCLLCVIALLVATPHSFSSHNDATTSLMMRGKQHIFFFVSAVLPTKVTNQWAYSATEKFEYYYETAAYPYTYAKARCEQLGGNMLSYVNNAPITFWSGFQISPENVSYVLSSQNLPSNWQTKVDETTYTTKDDSCYQATAGLPPIKQRSCTTSPIRKNFCERDPYPKLGQWKVVDDIEIALVSIPTTRNDAKTVCENSYEGTLAFFPNKSIVDEIAMPLAQGVAELSWNTSLTTACGATCKTGLWYGFNMVSAAAGEYDNNAKFPNYNTLFSTDYQPDVPVGPQTDCPALIGNTTEASVTMQGCATALPFFCSRIPRKWTTSLSKTSFSVEEEVELTIALSTAVTKGDLKIFILSSQQNAFVATPNPVVFEKCTSACTAPELTQQTVSLFGIQAGSNIEVILEPLNAGDLSVRTSPSWSTVNKVTINGFTSITFSPSSFTLKIGEVKTLTATLPSNFDSSKGVICAPPTSDCVNFGLITFTHGSATANVKVIGLQECSTADYQYIAMPLTSFRYAHPSVLSITVPALVTFSLGSLSANPFMYDGGSSTKLDFTVTPSSASPVTSTLKLSHNCSDILSLTPSDAQRTWSSGATSGQTFSIECSSIPVVQRWCNISWTLTDETGLEVPDWRSLHIRQQITLEFIGFPTVLRRDYVMPYTMKIPRYWGSSAVNVKVTLSGLSPTTEVTPTGGVLFSEFVREGSGSVSVSDSVVSNSNTDTVSYSITGTDANSFRGSSDQPPIKVKMTTTSKSNELVQVVPVNYDYITYDKAKTQVNITVTDTGFSRFGGGVIRLWEDCNPDTEEDSPDKTLNIGDFGSNTWYVYSFAAPSSGSTCCIAQKNTISNVYNSEIVLTMTLRNQLTVSASKPSSSVLQNLLTGTWTAVPVVVPRLPLSSSITITPQSSFGCATLSPAKIINWDDAYLEPYTVWIKATTSVACSSRTMYITTTCSEYNTGFNNDDDAMADTIDVQDKSLNWTISVNTTSISSFESYIELTISFPWTSSSTYRFYPSVSGDDTGTVSFDSSYVEFVNGNSADKKIVMKVVNPGTHFYVKGEAKYYSSSSSSWKRKSGQFEDSVYIIVQKMLVLYAEMKPKLSFVAAGQEVSFEASLLGPAPTSSVAVTLTGDGNVSLTPTALALSSGTMKKAFSASGSNNCTITVSTTNSEIDIQSFVLTFMAISNISGYAKLHSRTDTVAFVGQQVSVTIQFPIIIPQQQLNISFFSETTNGGVTPSIEPTNLLWDQNSLSKDVAFTVDYPWNNRIFWNVSSNESSNSVYIDSIQLYPNIFVRPKMTIAISSDFPSSIYQGSANKKTFKIICGQPYNGTVTFSLSMTGTNAANLNFGTTSFTRTAGMVSEAESITVEATGEADVLFKVIPSDTIQYESNSTELPLVASNLRNMAMNLSSRVLYGSKDFINGTLTNENAMTTGQWLVIAQTFNATSTAVTTFGGTQTFSVGNDNPREFNITVDGGFDYNTAPVYVRVSHALQSGTALSIYNPIVDEVIVIREQLNFSLDVKGVSTLFVGENNKQTMAVVATGNAKPGRQLKVSISCVNETAEEVSCTLNPSFVVFTETSATTINFEVYANNNATLRLELNVDYTSSNAPEFYPANTVSAVFDVKDTVSIQIYKLNDWDYLPFGASKTINASTVLTIIKNAVDEVHIDPWVPNPTIFSVSPSAGYMWDKFTEPENIKDSFMVTCTVVDENSLPITQQIYFNVTAPTEFSQVTIPSKLTFTIVKRLVIDMNFTGGTIYMGSTNQEYLQVTVPAARNKLVEDPPNALKLNMSCNATGVLDFPALPVQFSSTTTYAKLYVNPGSSAPSTGYLQCTAQFLGEAKSEYKNLATVFNFRVKNTFGMDIEVLSQAYINQTVSLKITLLGLLNECPEGRTFTVFADFSPAERSLPQMTYLWNVTSANKDSENARSMEQTFQAASQGTFTVSYTYDGTCYAFTRSAGLTSAVAIKPPDTVEVKDLSAYSFLDTPYVIKVVFNPSVNLYGTDDIQVKIQFGGAANSLSITGSGLSLTATNSWLLFVPPMNTSTEVALTVKGLLKSDRGDLTFEVIGSRVIEFGGGIVYSGRNGTQIPDLQDLIFRSNQTQIGQQLEAGNNLLTVYEGEYFFLNVSLGLELLPGLTVGLNATTNDTFLAMNDCNQSSSTLTQDGYQVFCFFVKNQTFGTFLNFTFVQSNNLFRYPKDITFIIKERVVFYVTGVAPKVIRINPANGRLLQLYLPQVPARADFSINLVASPPGYLKFSPPNITWLKSGFSLKNQSINITALSVPSVNISITFLLSTSEFQLPFELYNYEIQVRPLGTVYISDARQRIFLRKSMIVLIALDYPPINTGLSVTPGMQKPANALTYFDVDYFEGATHWGPGASNYTRQIEVFGRFATPAALPFYYNISSQEFSPNVVCVGGPCETLFIVNRSTIRADLDRQAVVLFIGDSFSFGIEIPSCFESTVKVIPQLLEFPKAIQFTPPNLEWSCLTRNNGSMQNVTMTGLDVNDGEDPTPRMSAVTVEVIDQMAGASPATTITTLAINVEVRAPARLPITVSDEVLFFGRTLTATISPTRPPSRGDLTVSMNLETPNPSYFLVGSPVKWLQSLSGTPPESQTITLKQNNEVSNVPFNLTFSMQGVAGSQNEFRINDSFSGITQAPRTISLDLDVKNEYYINIRYFGSVWLDEAPEVGTTVSIALTIYSSSIQQSLSTPIIHFSHENNGNSTEWRQCFSFLATRAATYALSFQVGGSALSKFNSTINTTIKSVDVHELIKASSTTISHEQFVQVDNQQRFTVSIPQSPVGNQYLTVVPLWGKESQEVNILPASHTFSAQEPGNKINVTFKISSDTQTVGTPGDLVLNFSGTPEYNMVPLNLGVIKFIPLHYILAPVKTHYSIFVGDTKTIDIIVSDLPPNTTTAPYVLQTRTDRSLQVAPSTVYFYNNDTSKTRKVIVTGVKVGWRNYLDILVSNVFLPTSFNTAISRRITFDVLSLISPTVSLGSEVQSEIIVYEGALNKKRLNITVPAFPPEAQDQLSLLMTITATEPNYAKISIASWTFTTGGSIFPTLEGINSGTPPTPLELKMTLSGSHLFVSEATVPIKVVPRHGYSFRDVPSSIFVGVNNSKTFFVRPNVIPSDKVLTLFLSACSEVKIYRTGSSESFLRWNRTNHWQSVSFYAAADAVSCFLSIGQGDTSIVATMEREALTSPILLVPAPSIRLVYIVADKQTDTLSADIMRQTGIRFRLLLAHSLFLPQGNITVTGENLTASVTMVSSVTEETSPNGFNAMMKRYMGSTGKIYMDVNPQRSAIEIVLKADPSYLSYEKETIHVKCHRFAIVNYTWPNIDESTVQLYILPDERGAPEIPEQNALEATVFSASTVSGMVSLASAAQAGKVLTIASMMRCDTTRWIDEQDDMPFYIAPIPINLGAKENLGGYAGAVLSNFLLVGAIAAIHYGFCKLVQKMRGSGYQFEKVMGALAFPALIWFPTLLLYQTTLQSAIRILLYSPLVTAKILGSIAVLFLMGAIPFAMVKLLSKASDLTYKPPNRKGWLRWLFFRGEFRHVNNPTWVGRYGLPLAMYRPEALWFLGLELLIIISLAAVTALQPKNESHCVSRVIVALLIFVIQFLCMLLVQPFSAKFDNFFFIIGYGVQVAAMAFIVHSTISKEDVAAVVTNSSRILLAFGSMLVVKALIDWWFLFGQGLKLCAVLDPASERTFSRAKEITGDFGEEMLLQSPGDEGDLEDGGLFEESVDKEGKKLRVPVAKTADLSTRISLSNQVAPLVCSTTYRGSGPGNKNVTLTGFQRALDPSVMSVDATDPHYRQTPRDPTRIGTGGDYKAKLSSYASGGRGPPSVTFVPGQVRSTKREVPTAPQFDSLDTGGLI